jgi:hypothetical protein
MKEEQGWLLLAGTGCCTMNDLGTRWLPEGVTPQQQVPANSNPRSSCFSARIDDVDLLEPRRH